MTNLGYIILFTDHRWKVLIWIFSQSKTSELSCVYFALLVTMAQLICHMGTNSEIASQSVQKNIGHCTLSREDGS